MTMTQMSDHQTPSLYRIRLIAPSDNAAVEQVIRVVLQEFGCVGEGFAWADPELSRMYETYQVAGSAYWVVEERATGAIWGGGGFARLKQADGYQAVCELQKLYFHPRLRGQGLGRQVLAYCLQEAARQGYQRMYLETVDVMRGAIGLYEKMGFQPLSGPLGQTGHGGCTVFMARALSEQTEQRMPA